MTYISDIVSLILSRMRSSTVLLALVAIAAASPIANPAPQLIDIDDINMSRSLSLKRGNC